MGCGLKILMPSRQSVWIVVCVVCWQTTSSTAQHIANRPCINRFTDGCISQPAIVPDTHNDDERRNEELKHTGVTGGGGNTWMHSEDAGGSLGTQVEAHYLTVRSKHFSWEILETDIGNSEYVSCLVSVDVVGAGGRTCSSYHAEMLLGGEEMDNDEACAWCKTEVITPSSLRLVCQVQLTVSGAEVLAAMRNSGRRWFDFRIEEREHSLLHGGDAVGTGEGRRSEMSIGAWLRYECVSESGAKVAKGVLSCDAVDYLHPYPSFAATHVPPSKSQIPPPPPLLAAAAAVAVYHPQEGSVMLPRPFVLIAELAFGVPALGGAIVLQGGEGGGGERGGGQKGDLFPQVSPQVSPGESRLHFWWGLEVDGEEVMWQWVGEATAGDGPVGRGVMLVPRLEVGERVLRVCVGFASECQGGGIIYFFLK
jgi:hypothetical protein